MYYSRTELDWENTLRIRWADVVKKYTDSLKKKPALEKNEQQIKKDRGFDVRLDSPGGINPNNRKKK